MREKVKEGVSKGYDDEGRERERERMEVTGRCGSRIVCVRERHGFVRE